MTGDRLSDDVVDGLQRHRDRELRCEFPLIRSSLNDGDRPSARVSVDLYGVANLWIPIDLMLSVAMHCLARLITYYVGSYSLRRWNCGVRSDLDIDSVDVVFSISETHQVRRQRPSISLTTTH